MKVEFLNPFVEAAQEVLLADTKLTVTRGELALEKDPVKLNEIAVIVSLVGDVSGMVIYSSPEKVALEIVSRMMGASFTELDALVQSGVAELGNMITGRASIKLAEAGYQSNISPPAVIVGRDTIISTLDLPRVIVPMIMEPGTLTTHLALRAETRRNATETLPVPAQPELDPNGKLIFANNGPQ